jgi:hypothetical protein
VETSSELEFQDAGMMKRRFSKLFLPSLVSFCNENMKESWHNCTPGWHPATDFKKF